MNPSPNQVGIDAIDLSIMPTSLNTDPRDRGWTTKGEISGSNRQLFIQ